MGLIDRIVNAMRIVAPDPPLLVPDGSRAFLTGPGVVDPWTARWGIEEDPYEPTAPATYLAKSAVVYRATMLRATLFASLPLVLSRGKGKNRKTVETGPERDLFDSVNPWWTWDRLAQMTEMSLCLWGKSFWFVNRQGGRPRELWWAPPDRVKVVPSSQTYVKEFRFKPTNGGQDIVFSPEETVWIRTPNPMNEFDGLSAVAAIAMTADTSVEAIRSNRLIFKNGIQMAALVTPKPGTPNLTEDQAKGIVDQMDRRFRGVDKAHRVGTLTFPVDVNSMSMSPKDAEFLGALNWTKEDIALAFGVPLDLIGGQRTYANVDVSERLVWSHTVKPEADFIAAELTEQLLPMFGATDLSAAFDYSEVAPLSENADAIWTRAKDAWLAGGLTLNQYMEIIEQEPVKGILGDARVLPRGSALIDADGNLIATASGKGDVSAIGGGVVGEPGATGAPAKPAKGGDGGTAETGAGAGKTGDAGASDGQDGQGGQKPPEDNGTGRSSDVHAARSRVLGRTVAYGSEEHARLMQRASVQREPWERKIAGVVTDLTKRQRQSVLKLLREQERGYAADGQRLSGKELAESVFSVGKWISLFRSGLEPVLAAAYAVFGQAVLDDLGTGQTFDSSDPEVTRAAFNQANDFARNVTATTFRQLGDTLAEGLAKDEATADLVKRADAVMTGRLADAGEVIAVTETTAAQTNGGMIGAGQSGVPVDKVWLSQADDKVRETHVEAHGQIVGIEDDFHVGAATGPGPGEMGDPEEDADCRCFPSETIVVAGGIRAATQRFYRGDIVRIALDDGRFLTVTPNHPLLSAQGWVAAGLLDQGDQLLGCRVRDDAAVAEPYPDDAPSAIGQVFRALALFGNARRVVGASPQFHGDGMDGDVDVVWTNPELSGANAAMSGKQGEQFSLSLADASSGTLALGNTGNARRSGQPLAFVGVGVPHADDHRFAPVPRHDVGLGQNTTDRTALDAERIGNGLLGLSGKVATDDRGLIEPQAQLGLLTAGGRADIRADADTRVAQPCVQEVNTDARVGGNDRSGFAGRVAADHRLKGIGVDVGSMGVGASARDPSLLEETVDGRATASELLADGLCRQSAEVTIHNVVAVDRLPFSGHVYNLHTDSGAYLANGIIAHNCFVLYGEARRSVSVARNDNGHAELAKLAKLVGVEVG